MAQHRDEPYITLSSLCTRLSCNRSSVYRWVEAGLPYINLSKSKMRKNYRFKFSTVMEWLEQYRSSQKVQNSTDKTVDEAG